MLESEYIQYCRLNSGKIEVGFGFPKNLDILPHGGVGEGRERERNTRQVLCRVVGGTLFE